MEYRALGRTGLRTSVLCLGTMMFGGRTDSATSHRIIHKASEQGVNFIDTADVYAGTESETIVGEAIRDNRDQWVLATKFGSPRGSGVNDWGSSRKYIYQSIEGSLRRLATDYVDIYYLHREHHGMAVEETVSALGDLIRAGKIRAYGVSNHRAWKVAEFCRVADVLGVPRPAASQPCYNIANRQPEAEHFAACEHYGVGVVGYSPLARGVLTAKYEPGVTPDADTRAGRDDRRMMQTEWRPESVVLSKTIGDYAASRGISPGTFALAWVLNNDYVSSAIVGPRTEQQWDDYMPALDYRVTAEDEAFVDSLVATGHPSTPGFNDPGHPIFGRRPRL